MTVGELKDLLSKYDEEMEIVMKDKNTVYFDSIFDTRTKELRTYYGDNRNVVVLIAGGHIGAV
jgi:hypothetical protein